MPPKKPIRKGLKTPPSAPKKAEKKITIKPKGSVLSDLAQAVSGKDGVVEVLRFSSEAVIGFVSKVVSTGSLAIDKAVGIGGLPFGRVVEVYGKEQCGKTTLAQHIIANTQRMGGVAMLYDAEHKWDRTYAMSVGVDAETLQVVQPKEKSIEAGITFIDRALTHWIEEGHKAPLVIVWDSIAGTPTGVELADLSSQQPGVAARELRRAMRVLGEKVARAGALLLLINQTYEKIGAFGHGPKSSTYGGGGIRYHSTIRIEMIRTGTLKLPNGMPVGIEGIARVFKNSLGVPRDETFAIAYKRGFDDAWTLLEKLKEARFIHAGGGWYAFNEQGHEQIRWQGGFAQLDQMMRESPALRDRLVTIYKALP